MTTMAISPGPMPLRFRDLLEKPPVEAAAAAPAAPQRKDQADLSPAERQLFLDALTAVNTYGAYGQLVGIHTDMSHTMHRMPPNVDPNDPTGVLGQQRFLPWHRVFLYELEQQLQAAVSPQKTSIPYWDWANAEEHEIPEWLEGVTPTVMVGPAPMVTSESLTVSVIRSPGTQADLAAIVAGTTPFNVPSLDKVKQATKYTEFATGLENIHNLVHNWVGGTMSDLTTAAADPLFWMHHANIDRLWWEWYQNHGDQNPDLSGLATIMDPWRYDEPVTRDIGSFNYTYA